MSVVFTKKLKCRDTEVLHGLRHRCWAEYLSICLKLKPTRDTYVGILVSVCPEKPLQQTHKLSPAILIM